MSTVRVLLSVAVNHAWPFYQMYVKNTFLHGDLKEEVYMKLPMVILSPMIRILCENFIKPFMA